MADETLKIYLYCIVRFKNLRNTYFYLSDDACIKAGDFVLVPFGAGNYKKVGQVVEVSSCTAENAPYPPSKTKHLFEIVDKPDYWETKADSVTEQPRTAKAESIITNEAQKPNFILISDQTTTSKAEAPTMKQNSGKSKNFRFAAIAVVLVAVIVGLAVTVKHLQDEREQNYNEAMQEMADTDYTLAEQSFNDLNGYRDAERFAVYCKYAARYQNNTTYIGGAEEITAIQLQYDVDWQAKIDELEIRVDSYKAEKAAAEEKLKEEKESNEQEALRKQYSGKLPVEGMPMSCLKYTSLGAPDEQEKCSNYEHMVSSHRNITVRWYNSDGSLLAAGLCFKLDSENEMILHSFNYYGASSTSKLGQTSKNNSNPSSNSLQNDYDDPEDLYEENPDLYDNEDEAWDEWYDD